MPISSAATIAPSRSIWTYNLPNMDLRAHKEALVNLKTPLQGVFLVVLCILAFIVWLGLLVVATKLLMG